MMIPGLIEGVSFIGAVAIVYFAKIVLQKKIAKFDEEWGQKASDLNFYEHKNAA